MDSNGCFSKSLLLVFPPWHCDNTRRGAHTLADDQFIDCICLSAYFVNNSEISYVLQFI